MEGCVLQISYDMHSPDLPSDEGYRMALFICLNKRSSLWLQGRISSSALHHQVHHRGSCILVLKCVSNPSLSPELHGCGEGERSLSGNLNFPLCHLWCQLLAIFLQITWVLNLA